MCEFCSEYKITAVVEMDGKEYDLTTQEGQADFMLKAIEKKRPEVAEILTAIDNVVGRPESYETLTTQDTVAVLILLKALAHLSESPSVTASTFRVACKIASLPQFTSVFDKNYKPEMRDGRFSTTIMLDGIPKPN